MKQDPKSELIEMTSKYARSSRGVSLSSLQRDFKKVVKGISVDALEWSLAKAIRSRETPPWQEILEQLYEHSSKQVRAQFLNAILELVPELRRNLAFPAGKATTIKPKDTEQVSLDKITEFATSIEAHKIAIDLISHLYAKHNRALCGLSPIVQGAMLHYLARRGRAGLARRPATAQTRSETATRTICSFDGPTVEPTTTPPAPQAPTATPAAQPVERYTNLAVFDKTVSETNPLAETTPLVAGRQYVLAVSIDVKRMGVPVVGPEQSIRPIKTSEPVDLFVILTCDDEDDWEIPNPIGSLRLPPAGPSEGPATFSITPKKSGQEARRRPLLLRLYHRLNLIDSLVFNPFVQAKAAAALVASDGKPSLYLSVEGFPKRYDVIHPDLQPQALNIALKRCAGNKWRFDVVLDLDGEKVPLVAYATLSDQGLTEILDTTRKAWDEVIKDGVYTASPAGRLDFAGTIAKLVDAGMTAWLRLFGAGGGLPALAAIRTILEDNPPRAGAPIQIVCEEEGVDFIFPWLLLYPGPYVGQHKGRVDAFWGVRYAVEVQNLNPVPLREAGTACKVAYALWKNFGSLSGQQRDVLAKFAAARPTFIVIGEPAIESRPDLLHAFGQDLDVLYVFAHGYTRERGLSDLAVLAGLLKSKQDADEALSDELKELKDNLDAIARDNANDWINLTKSMVTLADLRKVNPHFRGHPFVFLNMCHSAQMNPGLADGFVAFFLESGACAVLGTECPMPPSFATTFAGHIFTELARGARIGEAVHAARLQCASDGNPLCLAYSLYGNADARLVPKESTST